MITVYPKSIAKKAARFIIGTKTAGWAEKDCDFLCDGIDDQIEINMAISLASYGCEIIILDGIYNITAPILVDKNNIHIKGNGLSTELKRCWDSVDIREGILNLTNAGFCSISNLKVFCGIVGIEEPNSSNIYLNSCHDCIISFIQCEGSPDINNGGIYLYNSVRNVIANNYCTGIDGAGILLYTNCYGNVITANVLNANCYGVRVSNSKYNNISNNYCTEGTSGILLASAISNVINNNVCLNNDNGISISSFSYNNTITGNNCTDNLIGILLNKSARNNVNGNTCIKGTGQAGDYTATEYTIRLLGSDCSYNLISANICTGKAVDVGTGTGNTFYNNKFDAS